MTVVIICSDGRKAVSPEQHEILRTLGIDVGTKTMDEISQVLDQHPEAEICDFCSGKPVVWEFPARDHTQVAQGGVPLGNSVGSWAACAPCAALIKSEARNRLAKRSADCFRRRHLRSASVAEFRQIHDQFWLHRLGDGKPLEQEQS